MKCMIRGLVLCALGLSSVLAAAQPSPEAPPTAGEAGRLYLWRRAHAEYLPLSARIVPPPGFTREPAPRGSAAHWLRHLPLLPPGSPVRSYAGKLILAGDDSRLAAVVDLDLSSRDRQQCADTIMRMHGERLFALGQSQKLRLPWSGAARFAFADWCRGVRPVRDGRRWNFIQNARPTRGHGALRAYLEVMFSWTGTQHIAGEPKVKPGDARAGDFFVQGGSPGHAVLILDVARDARGRRVAMLAQGFMPAQQMHVLRGEGGSPWFPLDPGGTVDTPFWRPFRPGDLRRFKP